MVWRLLIETFKYTVVAAIDTVHSGDGQRRGTNHLLVEKKYPNFCSGKRAFLKAEKK